MPWCWEGLGAGGEGDNRGWDGWMASLTWWTWVWVNSGSWWWTGRPSVLRFMGSQRVGYNWATELNWILIKILKLKPGINIHCEFLLNFLHLNSVVLQYSSTLLISCLVCVSYDNVWCLWMCCQRRLFRVSWTSRIKPVNPKEINYEYSLERLVLKLKFQYFGHLIQRANSLENTLMLGKIEGKRTRGWQRRDS